MTIDGSSPYGVFAEIFRGRYFWLRASRLSSDVLIGVAEADTMLAGVKAPLPGPRWQEFADRFVRCQQAFRAARAEVVTIAPTALAGGGLAVLEPAWSALRAAGKDMQLLVKDVRRVFGAGPVFASAWSPRWWEGAGLLMAGPLGGVEPDAPDEMVVQYDDWILDLLAHPLIDNRHAATAGRMIKAYDEFNFVCGGVRRDRIGGVDQDESDRPRSEEERAAWQARLYDFEEATPAFLDAWSATGPAWRRLADGLAADAERRGDDANAGDVAVLEADRAFHGAAQAVEACLQPLRRAYYLKVDAVCPMPVPEGLSRISHYGGHCRRIGFTRREHNRAHRGRCGCRHRTVSRSPRIVG